MRKAIFILIVFLLVQMLAPSVAVLFSKLTDTPLDTADFARHPSVLAWVSLAADVVIILLVSLFMCIDGKSYFKENLLRRVPFRGWLAALALCFPYLIGVNMLAEMIRLPDFMQTTFSGLADTFAGIFLLAVMGPVVEELCFRHGILRALEEKSSHPRNAIIVSSLMFGIVHLNPAQIMAAFLVGIFLGWLYCSTRSLIPCIICHILNNSLAVLQTRLLGADVSFRDMIGNNSLFLLLFVVIVMINIVLWKVLKNSFGLQCGE